MSTPDELESKLSRIPRGRVSDSFQVLAEWLRENRRALEAQITGLAVRFEEIDRENKRQLAEIHAETRKTNGRVTDLEQQGKLEHALADGHQQWESEQEQQARQEAEAHERAREKYRDRLMGAGYIFLGILAGALARKLGIA